MIRFLRWLFWMAAGAVIAAATVALLVLASWGAI